MRTLDLHECLLLIGFIQSQRSSTLKSHSLTPQFTLSNWLTSSTHRKHVAHSRLASTALYVTNPAVPVDPSPTLSSQSLSIRVLRSLSEIPRTEWNRFLNGSSCPFLDYDWLHTLERSGCVSADEGWDPVHLLVTATSTNASFIESNSTDSIEVGLPETEIIVAVCPLYVKYHSYGEFIFDQQWASFAESVLGAKYYPKILSAIPFTPSTGSRLLVDPSLPQASQQRCRIVLVEAMQALARGNKLLSANVNFLCDNEVSLFEAAGFERRQTIQYRWRNFDPSTGLKYGNFDQYLGSFKSKRRTQIKRERRSIAEQGIRVVSMRGDDPRAGDDLYQRMHAVYATTIQKMWGQMYLNRQFFAMLAKTSQEFRHKIVLILAYDQNDDLVAGTFNLASETHFRGRYWGSFAEVRNLHFEVCYYAAIEFCIENGIEYMEPGAGGGEYKFLRGFDPFLVNSMHFFTSASMTRAVSEFLRQERQMNLNSAERMIENSAVKKNVGNADDDDNGSID